MTIKKALLTDILPSWPVGKTKSGPEICQRVKSLMYNSEGRLPMDSTVMRELRNLAYDYGIHCTSKRKSSYERVK